ncbi:MAG: hypothetical protein GBAus27B_000093 [Mycoplasmataceae bacterium]|nr:MAG: hypothetical protein GBAus27B_000093 [Mycoplasmataceae bacterium]
MKKNNYEWLREEQERGKREMDRVSKEFREEIKREEEANKRTCQDCGIIEDKVFMNEFANGKIVCKYKDACNVRQAKPSELVSKFLTFDNLY